MGSNAKRQQTMAKFAREQRVKERRAQKQLKRRAKKQAETQRAGAVDAHPPSEHVLHDETGTG